MLALYELNSQPSPIRLVVVLCALPVRTVLWLFVFLYCQRSIFTEQFAARCHIGLYTPVVLQPAENSSVHRVLQTRCCWLTDTTMLFLFYMFSEPCIFFQLWLTDRLRVLRRRWTSSVERLLTNFSVQCRAAYIAECWPSWVFIADDIVVISVRSVSCCC